MDGMNNGFKRATESIKIFQDNPKDSILNYYIENGIKYNTIVLNDTSINDIVQNLNTNIKSSIDVLSEELDLLNRSFVQQFPKEITIDTQTKFVFKPLQRVGIYVPNKLPSSAYTFLSAAKAAGVSEVVVYLAINKNNKEIDPASVYVAKKYGATVTFGPAAYGFQILSFGVENVIDKCDKIYGPCGNSLNFVKQISSIVAKSDTDMSAGSSELVILTDKSDNLVQIKLDLLSQLEHGKDSMAYLVLVNQSPSNYTDILVDNKDKIKIIAFDNWADGINHVNCIAPETAVIYSCSEANIESAMVNISSAGVCYVNCVNSLGDYGAIGRGCADPTGGMAKSQSGISPLQFMKVIPFITSTDVKEKNKQAARNLAEYEGLKNHANAIDNDNS